MKKSPQMIAIAGGNRAILQPFFSVLMGVCTACLRKHCILGTLDENDTDLHQFLNIESVKAKNVFFGRSDVHIKHTRFNHLDAIAFRSFYTATVDNSQQQECFQELKRLEADYIILDLGTASSQFSLNAFLEADERFILTTGDMFSVLDAYSLIRSALLCKLSQTFQDHPEWVKAFNECGFLVDGKYVKPLDNVATIIESLSEDSFIKFKKVLATFRPRILLATSANVQEMGDYKYLKPLTKDLLGIDVIEAGSFCFDESTIQQKNIDSILSYLQKNGKEILDLMNLQIFKDEPVDYKLTYLNDLSRVVSHSRN